MALKDWKLIRKDAGMTIWRSKTEIIELISFGKNWQFVLNDRFIIQRTSKMKALEIATDYMREY